MNPRRSVSSATDKPQSQASLTDQLQELRTIANREGLYDAADWLKKQLDGALRRSGR